MDSEYKKLSDNTNYKENTLSEIICKTCGRKNRLIARYCRYCGNKIDNKIDSSNISFYDDIDLNEVIGMDEIKKSIDDLINSVKINSIKKSQGLFVENLYLHSIFMGSTGTGKSLIAKILTKTYNDIGVLSTGNFIEVKAKDIKQNFEKYIKQADGGVLFIDEVHKNIEIIDEVAKIIDNNRCNFIFILAGLTDEIKKYIDLHKDVIQRFADVYMFKDYSQEDLLKIFKFRMARQGYITEEKALAKLMDVLYVLCNSVLSEFKNGWLVIREIIPKVISLQNNRLAKLPSEHITRDEIVKIIEEDIPDEYTKRETPEEVISSINNLIGLNEVKAEIVKLARTINIQKQLEAKGIANTKVAIHIVFTGNPGTGKTTIARKLGKLFKAIGYLPTDKVIEVDRGKLVGQYVGQTAPLVLRICDEARGGILFIDEAYTLTGVEEGLSDSFGQEAIDTLLKRMEDDRGNMVVIAAGYKNEMARFIKSNPGLQSRFTNYINLEDYSPNELLQIFQLNVNTSGRKLEKEALSQLELIFKEIYEKRDKTFANGRTVRKLFEDTLKEQATRLSKLPQEMLTQEEMLLIKKEDIPYQYEKVENKDEIFKDLNNLIGMQNIKDELTQLMDFVLTQKKREKATGKKMEIVPHFVFTGNPGTGKTTIARILGRLFKNIGLLPTSKLVEKSGKDLVGQYVGQTPKKVNEIIDSALGGVLFIDEAYMLTPEGQTTDSYSKEAIDTLMKRMEDDRGKFIVIVAGYKKDMERFIDSNPGLTSRFSKKFHFEDYNSDELKSIFMITAKSKGYQLQKDAEEVLSKICCDMYNNRGDNFGNGRDIRNLFEKTIQKQASRLSKEYDNIEPTDSSIYSLIISNDLYEVSKKSNILTIEDSIRRLENLIGLNKVKDEIRNLVKYLQVETARINSGGKKTDLNLHTVFSGNPGTGKTTVARILCSIYKSLGILSKGHLVEVDRSRLVGQYIGETAIKTQKVIDEAIGGVLFIDEAYTLSSSESNSDYGKESIDTLLKNMEDHKGKFIVIAAGYIDLMKRFIQSNPGLPSRFTKFIDFEDYRPEELKEIFLSMVNEKGMKYSSEFEKVLENKCKYLYNNRDKNFANGRTMRNIFEETLQKQAIRVADLVEKNVGSDILNKLEENDLA